MAADSIPAVVEAEATGLTADLFADIRQTLELPVVNLVWRHLATLPDGLEWTWTTLKPYYLSGAIAQAAGSFLSQQDFTPPLRFSSACLSAANIPVADLDVIRAIIDSYHRGNAMNIIALCLPQTSAPVRAAHLTPAPLPEIAKLTIPALPALDGLPSAHRDLVMELNTLGKHPDDPVVASLYRHLAPWPGLLSLSATLLQPLQSGGKLTEMIAAADHLARAHAAVIIGENGNADRPSPPPAVQAALQRFTQNVICRMVPICGLLRTTLAKP
jgi:hypothetical protein